jgi:acylphosphatase
MGWVRNLPDGRVEFVAAGAPGDLERLIVWAGRGPARAQVAEVSVVERSAPADLGPFVVRFFGEP